LFNVLSAHLLMLFKDLVMI